MLHGKEFELSQKQIKRIRHEFRKNGVEPTKKMVKAAMEAFKEIKQRGKK